MIPKNYYSIERFLADVQDMDANQIHGTARSQSLDVARHMPKRVKQRPAELLHYESFLYCLRYWLQTERLPPDRPRPDEEQLAALRTIAQRLVERGDLREEIMAAFEEREPQ